VAGDRHAALREDLHAIDRQPGRADGVDELRIMAG